jgi:hypothetical protein
MRWAWRVYRWEYCKNICNINIKYCIRISALACS